MQEDVTSCDSVSNRYITKNSAQQDEAEFT